MAHKHLQFYKEQVIRDTREDAFNILKNYENNPSLTMKDGEPVVERYFAYFEWDDKTQRYFEIDFGNGLHVSSDYKLIDSIPLEFHNNREQEFFSGNTVYTTNGPWTLPSFYKCLVSGKYVSITTPTNWQRITISNLRKIKIVRSLIGVLRIENVTENNVTTTHRIMSIFDNDDSNTRTIDMIDEPIEYLTLDEFTILCNTNRTVSNKVYSIRNVQKSADITPPQVPNLGYVAYFADKIEFEGDINCGRGSYVNYTSSGIPLDYVIFRWFERSSPSVCEAVEMANYVIRRYYPLDEISVFKNFDVNAHHTIRFKAKVIGLNTTDALPNKIYGMSIDGGGTIWFITEKQMAYMHYNNLFVPGDKYQMIDYIGRGFSSKINDYGYYGEGNVSLNLGDYAPGVFSIHELNSLSQVAPKYRFDLIFTALDITNLDFKNVKATWALQKPYADPNVTNYFGVDKLPNLCRNYDTVTQYTIYPELPINKWEIEFNPLWVFDIDDNTLIWLLEPNKYQLICNILYLQKQTYTSEEIYNHEWGDAYIDTIVSTYNDRGYYFDDIPLSPEQQIEMFGPLYDPIGIGYYCEGHNVDVPSGTVGSYWRAIVTGRRLIKNNKAFLNGYITKMKDEGDNECNFDFKSLVGWAGYHNIDINSTYESAGGIWPSTYVPISTTNIGLNKLYIKAYGDDIYYLTKTVGSPFEAPNLTIENFILGYNIFDADYWIPAFTNGLSGCTSSLIRNLSLPNDNCNETMIRNKRIILSGCESFVYNGVFSSSDVFNTLGYPVWCIMYATDEPDGIFNDPLEVINNPNQFVSIQEFDNCAGCIHPLTNKTSKMTNCTGVTVGSLFDVNNIYSIESSIFFDDCSNTIVHIGKQGNISFKNVNSGYGQVINSKLYEGWFQEFRNVSDLPFITDDNAEYVPQQITYASERFYNIYSTISTLPYPYQQPIQDFGTMTGRNFMHKDISTCYKACVMGNTSIFCGDAPTKYITISTPSIIVAEGWIYKCLTDITSLSLVVQPSPFESFIYFSVDSQSNQFTVAISNSTGSNSYLAGDFICNPGKTYAISVLNGVVVMSEIKAIV